MLSGGRDDAYRSGCRCSVCQVTQPGFSQRRSPFRQRTADASLPPNQPAPPKQCAAPSPDGAAMGYPDTRPMALQQISAPFRAGQKPVRHCKGNSCITRHRQIRIKRPCAALLRRSWQPSLCSRDCALFRRHGDHAAKSRDRPILIRPERPLCVSGSIQKPTLLRQPVWWPKYSAAGR